MSEKNDGIIITFMVIALIAFGIGVGVGIDIAINEDASADNVTNNTPTVVNVTEEMTSDSYVKNETTYNSEIDNSKYLK
ncbi:hypothetical protein MBBWO_03130 [Methanobrevibacter woesei]|uniref:Uncharacterized protein n=1 Tax=Methanobrevibacter woesei TaxID=190976 RepID=A0A2U1S8I5_9EURY|nr:hypothetical protein [Methanobrevibacter woesei]MCC9261476.1 hypothetical protein [Methanobrevibacter woesei]PWB86602.1 hypothetical protein MBBWO_03130 [Methanobrevibacter woesei]